MEDNRFIMYDIISEFYSCLSWVEGDSNKSNSLLETIRGVKDTIKPNEGNEGPKNAKKRLFDDYYQSTVLNEVTIRPPAQVKKKGSGSRIKLGKETSGEKKDKPLRTYRACGQRSHHDSRNCPQKECDTFNL
ncbi:hypothetical protein C2S51_037817 [Perilla frutescens var. frutescens]|nr:hypothetical protein C2S51_037817 [Perilla frutescens var. frutescens]